ncbi:MAG: hypothetical protein H7Y17_11375 [Chlorobia bacterium]|nr:hypothetical protein [Fimbriimonadaceae bacterium]
MDRRFGSLAELHSNVEAIDAALLFANGLNPFVAIVGPSGWGKTHLLECVSNHMAKEFGVRSQILSTLDWIHGRHVSDPRHPLLLDDAHEAMTRTRPKVQMRLGLERRVRIGRPTIVALTSDRFTRQMQSLLPSPREWSIHEVGNPTSEERRLVVQKMAELQGLRISGALAKILATRMKGNGNTLHGAINVLKMVKTAWLTAEDTLRACGYLDSFFADNPAWDLKDKVRFAAASTARQYPAVDGPALTCYAMIHVAHLGEIDVARACAVRPAKANELAQRFQKSLLASEDTRQAYFHFLETAAEILPEN